MPLFIIAVIISAQVAGMNNLTPAATSAFDHVSTLAANIAHSAANK